MFSNRISQIFFLFAKTFSKQVTHCITYGYVYICFTCCNDRFSLQKDWFICKIVFIALEIPQLYQYLYIIMDISHNKKDSSEIRLNPSLHQVTASFVGIYHVIYCNFVMEDSI